MSTTSRSITDRPHTAFKTPKGLLSLSEWLSHSNADKPFEYIHVYPQPKNAEIHLYRSYKECGSKDRLYTVIPNAKIRFSLNREYERPQNFYLTGGEANNLLTFLECLKWERSEARVTLRYYEDTQTGMMENREGITEESLNLRYKTKTDRRKEVTIRSLYESDIQSIANWG